VKPGRGPDRPCSVWACLQDCDLQPARGQGATVVPIATGCVGRTLDQAPPHTRVWPHENCATQRPGPGSQIFLRGSRSEGADGPEPAVRRVPARLDRRTRRPA
jgi:hypothetical protein